jgi:hypothetical protein
MTFTGKPIEILPIAGVNNGLDPINIEDRESPSCRNVRFRKNSVFKREGAAPLIPPSVDAGAITGIFELAKDDGAVDVIAFSSGSAARRNGAVWSSIKGAVTLTAGQNIIWQGAQLTNLQIVTNDVDPIYKYAGGATNLLALGGTPPVKARAVVAYRNYLIFLNTEEGGTRRRARFRWSELNNAELYPAANFNDLLNAGGQFGVGFGQIGDQLYAFLNRSIYQISYTGDDVTPFAFSIAHPSIGTVAGKAIVEVDGAIYFANQKGIFLFDGGVPKYISKRIEGTWKSINSARFPYIAGIHNEKHTEVRFSISTGSSTQNEMTVTYDYSLDRWTIDDGFAANYWANLPESASLQPCYGEYDGMVQKSNQATFLDNTLAINAFVQTKPLDFGTLARRRKVRQLIIISDLSSTAGAVVEVRSAYDLQTLPSGGTIGAAQEGAVYDTAIFDVDAFAAEGQAILTHRPDGHGRLWQCQLGNSQASIGLNISRMEALVKGDADE